MQPRGAHTDSRASVRHPAGAISANISANISASISANTSAQAIDFVHASADADLWEQLLAHSMRSPGLTSALLEHVCASPLLAVEPATLVRRLPERTHIYGLKGYLLKILEQVRSPAISRDLPRRAPLVSLLPNYGHRSGAR